MRYISLDKVCVQNVNVLPHYIVNKQDGYPKQGVDLDMFEQEVLKVNILPYVDEKFFFTHCIVLIFICTRELLFGELFQNI